MTPLPPNDDADSARSQLFARLRAALEPRPEREPYPEYADSISSASRLLAGKTLLEAFTERLERVRGRVFREPDELVAWLLGRGASYGYVDPALEPLLAASFQGRLTYSGTFSRERLDDYHFGVTRADFAIAETGTLVLKDVSSSSRLAALAPWVHVAVVYEHELVPSLHQAIARLGDDPNVIFCTGPSKTADVEGILIEGVHGPGEQVALVLSSPDRARGS